MNPDKAYRTLPNMENHGCFGCGSMNPSGLRMKFFTDETSIVSWVNVPQHLCGWSNLVHGGVISTLLDEIVGRSA